MLHEFASKVPEKPKDVDAAFEALLSLNDVTC
jgi:hypothetical protein